MYFKNFNNIYYDFNIGDKTVLKPVKDITRNVRLRKDIFENITLYDEYDLKEGDTPEILAARIYGSSEYHWVIMLCNQRFNYIEDFPLSSRNLDEYINSKYDDPNAIKHYEKDGFIVDSTELFATPVSYYEYESALNESKRRIKLISPKFLPNILTQFKNII